MALTWPDDFIDKVICGDCTKILPLIPDDGIDAVITDPPYGINVNVDNSHLPNANTYDKIIGDDKPFNPKPLLRFADKPMFLWGANNYCHQLPQDWMWLIWDKTGGGTIKFMQSRSEVEICATNACGTHRIFHHYWNGFLKENEMGEPIVHPTQKPVALMRWIVNKWTKPGDVILDPYAGSGTLLVACKELDRRFIGIEISPKYCKIAEDRLAQGELFNETVVG